GAEAASDVVVTILLAIFTAGVGAAANIAAKSGRLVKVAKMLEKLAGALKRIKSFRRLPKKQKKISKGRAARRAKSNTGRKGPHQPKTPDKKPDVDANKKSGYRDNKDGQKKKIASAEDSNKLSKLRPVSSLNKRQKAILKKLANKGDVAQFRKKDVSMADLQSLSEVTGDEYNMFTLGGGGQ
ncbi:MAG: hypothetical protein PVH87_05345, partial [Desulfobacteraceae bacterium]